MQNDFRKFALSSGVSGMLFDDYSRYAGQQAAYVNPSVIEERQLNCTVIDVFSRLLLDRQIFLGTEINDDVANIVHEKGKKR